MEIDKKINKEVKKIEVNLILEIIKEFEDIRKKFLESKYSDLETDRIILQIDQKIQDIKNNHLEIGLALNCNNN